MENLMEAYKTGALISAKNNSQTVKMLQEERRLEFEKVIKSVYANTKDNDQLIQKLIDGEVVKVEAETPIIDISKIDKVKTLEEFINEQRNKDREEISQIAESLSELINQAPEEDVVTMDNNTESNDIEEPIADNKPQKENDDFEDLLNESIESQENDDFDELLNESVEGQEKEDNDKTKEEQIIEPKYFIIDLGDEENPFQIVTDIEGKDVGKIIDGNFQMNQEYFNDKMEKFNIDGYISAKVHDSQIQQKIREEIQPKSLEELAQMDLDKGKEIIENVDKTIEDNEKDVPPQEQEKGIKDKVDETELAEDEEEKGTSTIEELDEIAEEKDSKKLEDYLDENSSRKLIILRPKSMTDQLDNDGLDEKGDVITVYQLKGSIKPIYVLTQGERVLYGDQYNEQIQKNMSRVPYTSGVVREVSDEVTTAKVILADGKEEKFLAKGEPADIEQSQKEAFIFQLDELSKELKRIMEITPDDMVDYKIEFPGGASEKCQRIDQIEMQMYELCVKYGIAPPENIKANAVDETTVEKLPENEEGLEDDGPRTLGSDYAGGRLPTDHK